MLENTWWDCVKNDMACGKTMPSSGINGEGELRGQPANPCSPGKMAMCAWIFNNNIQQY